ncbi:hypothetical protein E3O21_18590 [Cryobacterium flavum]|uniref:Uncharacterized protein n=1 Tax=Cryobacterium flavum TaxID=1424659 RepID=A0ABY2I043_9MICO|nr:hypothetical protein E3O21_18590 [Cryobacterium flavum]
MFIRGGGQLRFDEGGRLSFAALKPILDPDRQRAKLAAAQLATRPANAAAPPVPPQPSPRKIAAPPSEVSADRRPTFHP